MQRKIKWEKWINPLGDEKELESKEEYFEKDDSESEPEEEELSNRRSIPPVVLTQFGILPVKPYNHPAKHFNFWICHTNFTISHHVKKIIMEVPGVEIFDIFSPYRFRIAVGMCFDERQVLDHIEYMLVTVNEVQVGNDHNFTSIADIDKELTDKIDKVKEDIEKNHHLYWAILILPNKQLEYIHTNDLKEFQKKKEEFQKVKNITTGIMLTSDGQNS